MVNTIKNSKVLLILSTIACKSFRIRVASSRIHNDIDVHHHHVRLSVEQYQNMIK